MNYEEPSQKNFRLFHQKTTKSISALPITFNNFHRKVASSPYSSPYKDSIPSEMRANSPKNCPLSFNTLHSKYQTASDSSLKPSLPTSSPRKKYMNSIHRLNQEIQIMSTQLKLAHDTIAILTSQLNEINHKHAQHIQEIHERHEQKITKLRNDIDKLFQYNGMNAHVSVHKIIAEKNLELEDLQLRFKEKQVKLEKEYEKRLMNKEIEHKEQISLLKIQFLDVVEELKDKFLIEIQGVQGEFKKEVEKVKEAFKGLAEINSDSEVSTGFEYEQEKNNRPTSVSDLQVIEELSFPQNMLKNFDDIPGVNEFDASLHVLINQIEFDSEVSLSDILSN